ncbi:hypothetical protein [Symmachiella dynata]|uniref:hypothetical protein n=1 Tax=Symmachiella dynata TaxID=2527995 RepID=UPI0030EE76ED
MVSPEADVPPPHVEAESPVINETEKLGLLLLMAKYGTHTYVDFFSCDLPITDDAQYRREFERLAEWAKANGFEASVDNEAKFERWSLAGNMSEFRYVSRQYNPDNMQDKESKIEVFWEPLDESWKSSTIERFPPLRANAPGDRKDDNYSRHIRISVRTVMKGKNEEIDEMAVTFKELVKDLKLNLNGPIFITHKPGYQLSD